MKVLIDTNVILDVLCDRADFVEASSKVWKYCELKKIQGYISALSIPNIVYILRKELTPQKTQELISQIMLIFEVMDLKTSDLKNAGDMYLSDFEDAVQMSCANRIKADYIITRNIRDFKESKVLALKPSELLDRI
ncbi:MAG: PIN domain-containing protein [Oscillospiraceae bacterium]|nr:PIN domain-containing protein [Oscillospiraceae bacterium]